MIKAVIINACVLTFQKSGVFSKLIVCGMIASGLGIADPEDQGMLDICGFDSRAVEVIRNFVLDVI